MWIVAYPGEVQMKPFYDLVWPRSCRDSDLHSRNAPTDEEHRVVHR